VDNPAGVIKGAAIVLSEDQAITLWHSHMGDILRALEARAMDLDPDHPQAFELFLQRLQDTIADRLTDGRW
jgi:hypothetical protein